MTAAEGPALSYTLTLAAFLLPVVLQVVSGYSPLGSGLALLPLTGSRSQSRRSPPLP